MRNGLRHSIPSNTEFRSTKMLGRVLVDLNGPKQVAVLGKKPYVGLFCDHFPRFMWVYFIVHKDDVVVWWTREGPDLAFFPSRFLLSKEDEKVYTEGCGVFSLGACSEPLPRNDACFDEQMRAVIISRHICLRDVMPSSTYVPPPEKRGWSGAKRGVNIPQMLEPGGQPGEDDATSDSTESEEGRGWWSMELHLSPRCRIKGGGMLDTSAHAGDPAPLGHQAVALPKLRLAQEPRKLEATVVGAITKLWRGAEVRSVREQAVYRSRRTMVR